MSGDDWCVWMKLPPTNPDKPGHSMIADGLTEDEAKALAGRLVFEGRAMPEEINGSNVSATNE